ncbi:protein DnrP [Pseudomonas chlororaphis]|uniref:Protein DnrP n=1 Tax=Pseudomonas chlororaphis TaxID=587753 RepID=A0AAQ0AP53_9PSED|nr:protein DnrP [Pseudomonas chlororaphis]AUG41575.1 protein DnrP [Pseudomonas chlororaphis]QNR45433.1 protein DnrP [Pseudomonas chlororaphis]
MSAGPVCLYCQQSNPPRQSACRHCGMPLPATAAHAEQRRLRRFTGFCIGLTIFCVAMFFWLPRS